MYVKAHLDLSLKSLVCFGCVFGPCTWKSGGSWLPWAVPRVVFLFLFGS